MTFKQFVFNNVFRNKRLYIAYFLSSLFTVMVFFTFANFAFHPIFTLENINTNVFKGLAVAGGIIYIFSFFFVLYSMSSFLQSRKKEFSILMLLGMTNKQIRRLVFLENILIGFFSTIGGIGLGLVFSKFILLIAENVLVIDNKLNFYFPISAITITFLSFMILFVGISFFVLLILRSSKLITLLRNEKVGKKEPKFSVIASVLAVFLLGTGYFIALTVKGTAVVLALIPVSIIVTIGTYLLFTQLSLLIIYRFKNNKQIFWRKTNMLLFADLSYRMRDNARSFFIVAIISTVAFSSIGTLIGLNSFLTKGVIEANPTSFSYMPFDDESIEEIDKNITLIEDSLSKYNISYEKAEADLAYFNLTEGKATTLIAKTSDYNSYARLIGENEITVDQEEALFVDHSKRVIDRYNRGDETLETIPLNNGELLPVNIAASKQAKQDVLPELFEYYIVHDDTFKQLPKAESITKRIDWQVTEGNDEEIISVGEELSEQFIGQFTAIDFVVYEIHATYSPIMFVGLFIGIIFFVSAGSFLYFRLYTDLDEDRAKFSAIRKIGLTNREIKQIISRQTALLFFAPVILAIVHGAVALTALSRLFNYNLTVESIIVLTSFFFIQLLYFIIVRYFYTRQIYLSI